jgi:hypothetical protein
MHFCIWEKNGCNGQISWRAVKWLQRPDFVGGLYKAPYSSFVAQLFHSFSSIIDLEELAVPLHPSHDICDEGNKARFCVDRSTLLPTDLR